MEGGELIWNCLEFCFLKGGCFLLQIKIHRCKEETKQIGKRNSRWKYENIGKFNLLKTAGVYKRQSRCVLYHIRMSVYAFKIVQTATILTFYWKLCKKIIKKIMQKIMHSRLFRQRLYWYFMFTCVFNNTHFRHHITIKL